MQLVLSKNFAFYPVLFIFCPNPSTSGKISHARACSSMAEQAAHNRLVEGSNPSGPIFVYQYPVSFYHADLALLIELEECFYLNGGGGGS